MFIHLMSFNLNHFSYGKQGLFLIINSFHIDTMNCQPPWAGVALRYRPKVRREGMKKVAIVGLGWLGMPLAMSLAARGWQVTGSKTTLDGVMEKYIPGDYEFDVPAKLISLYHKKDYGRYGENGKMPVCFIATNHTTGGNSGSPALDAYGNLIGLNFDRVWEGTMSDINYDPSICRNIMVDIRYVLFIVDKFAGATHLIDEMKLVQARK